MICEALHALRMGLQPHCSSSSVGLHFDLVFICSVASVELPGVTVFSPREPENSDAEDNGPEESDVGGKGPDTSAAAEEVNDIIKYQVIRKPICQCCSEGLNVFPEKDLSPLSLCPSEAPTSSSHSPF